MPQQVLMAERKRRNRILRELAEVKNRAFRQSQIGNTISVVTLQQPFISISSNYLKVELARECEPNLLMNIQVGGLTRDGLREVTPFAIL
jgi:tRNA A37 methylthiotransferase MiaB